MGTEECHQESLCRHNSIRFVVRGNFDLENQNRNKKQTNKMEHQNLFLASTNILTKFQKIPEYWYHIQIIPDSAHLSMHPELCKHNR